MAMASAEPADRPSKRRPFSNWVKKIANLNHSNNGKKAGIPLPGSKKKANNATNGGAKNNPYPQSGTINRPRHSVDNDTQGHLTIATSVSRRPGDDSCDSLPSTTMQEHDRNHGQSNRSAAPTLATQAGTISSDAGQSKAPTTATGAGALSSISGAGAGSTFSSPNQSEHSLTTTLTTIQSQSPGIALQGASGQPNTHHHGSLNNPNPVMFSHQYPVSPSPSTTTTMSAIPRHMNESIPNTYSSATANNLLSDNASILTLASSSKRRRRSIDSHTDASVRAIPPSSVWGGSRESLPLSVLSANAESGAHNYAQGRPSIGGLASAERASVYSSQGVSAPALASERNSYYAASQKQTKDLGDAKSLRSITNLDTRSINDAKSLEVGSLKNYEGSVRSGAFGHSRNDSIPGSIGSALVNNTPVRHPSSSGARGRRSGDWQEVGTKEDGDYRRDAESKENRAD